VLGLKPTERMFKSNQNQVIPVVVFKDFVISSSGGGGGIIGPPEGLFL
jgi:hypothetical protein